MQVVDEVTQFAEELRQASENVTTEITTFHSGGVDLDVRSGDRLLVLAYLPSYEMFGVDEPQPEDGLTSTYRFGYKDFQSAKAKLLEMLGEARPQARPRSAQIPGILVERPPQNAE